MKKVIILGSLNMDLSISCDRIPVGGETLNGREFYINPGGKGGNQGVSAAKMGAETYIIANVGDDMFGKQLNETLKSYGVRTEYVHTEKNASSGIAMVMCCEGDNRIILGNGANHTLNIDNVKESLDALGETGDIFLTQLENRYEVVKEAIIYAKQKGMYTILNPAPALLLEETLYNHLDLIVVNQSECELLSGVYPESIKQCDGAFDYFDSKKVTAIITLGSQGSVFRNNKKMIEVKSREVESVDSTAAGDSYIGALCAELANDKSLSEALKFASDVAALCVTRRGAQVAIPYRQEVLDYFKEENK